MSNDNLIKAKKAKNDEFYTQLSDIEKELSHYPIETFKDKVVYCPCDSTDYSNGYISNFAIYFYKNFKSLGLKKLICTCYSDGINYYEYNGINEFESHRGNGDFHSEYCTNLLAEADIVVTNPPFSLFRDFVKCLVDVDKKFIILGNINAAKYDAIFKHIITKKLFTGYTSVTEFITPNGGINKVACRWFTTVNKSCSELKVLVKTMEDGLYYTCGNYDAIYVDRINNIPKDYEGKILVPFTFLFDYNPIQFELLGCVTKLSLSDCPQLGQEFMDNYRAQGGTGHYTANEYGIWYVDKSGSYKRPYTPVVIRHRKDENGKLI